VKKNQVFVRAYDEAGKLGSADVLDLDDESFRVFVIGMLFVNELVCGIRDEFVEGPHIKLKLRPGMYHERDTE
jgi:hypothetical protein